MDRTPGRLGPATRVVAGLMGTGMLISGACAVVLSAWAAWEGRGDDARWHAAGVSGLLLGPFMVQSARTGRDELRAWLDRMNPHPVDGDRVRTDGH